MPKQLLQPLKRNKAHKGAHWYAMQSVHNRERQPGNTKQYSSERLGHPRHEKAFMSSHRNVSGPMGPPLRPNSKACNPTSHHIKKTTHHNSTFQSELPGIYTYFFRAFILLQGIDKGVWAMMRKIDYINMKIFVISLFSMCLGCISLKFLGMKMSKNRIFRNSYSRHGMFMALPYWELGHFCAPALWVPKGHFSKKTVESQMWLPLTF